jgi:tetratricopeptide (TPR) repeat protein
MACSRATERSARAAALLSLLPAACFGSAPVPEGGDGRFTRCESEAGQRARMDANQAWIAGDDPRAAAALREALAACPEHLPTHLLYIRTATRAGDDVAAAMQRFYAAMPDDGQSPLYPYLRAQLEPVEVVRLELLQEALLRDRRFHFAHVARGDLLASLGKPDQAIGEYEAALAIEPNAHDARRALAEQLEEVGRFPEAERHYSLYLIARPADLDSVRRTAHLRIFELGRAQEAAPLVQQLLAADPEEVEALMDQAAIDWFGGRAQAAAAGYRRVLELDWTEARAALSLGNLHYEVFAAAGGDARREALAKARLAYLYFLRLERARGPYDYWDLFLGVPHRIDRIDEEIGALAQRALPKVGEF